MQQGKHLILVIDNLGAVLLYFGNLLAHAFDAIEIVISTLQVALYLIVVHEYLMPASAA
jgi:hypothetical protein